MKRHWHKTAYGKIPFEKVRVISFRFMGSKDRDETAYLQYKLLLKENVLQAHIDPFTKQGKMVCSPKFKAAIELKKMGTNINIVSDKLIDYADLLQSNNSIE